jgi:hypothetical protein
LKKHPLVFITTQHKAAIIMITTTLIAPVSVMNVTVNEAEDLVGPVIIALLWSFWPSGAKRMEGLQILNIQDIGFNSSLTFMSLLFTYFVIRHLMGKTSRYRAYFTGLLSIIPPMLAGIQNMIVLIRNGIFVYSGAIPIQLFIGLIIVKQYAPIEDKESWLQENSEDAW